MTTRSAFRYWLFALVLSAAAVCFCMVYVDRPLAQFLEAHVRHTALWTWLNRVLLSFALVALAALLFLCGCGVWLISGRPLHRWTKTPLLCSCSTMMAIACEHIFKRIFGRGWPDPTFVLHHAYGFHFLHGETHWDSFPSGTVAVSMAILSVLWVTDYRWRVAGMAIVLFLSAGVVICNYHWLSDVIAGAFLGASIGWATTALLYCSTDWRETG
jgi:membrane-associated phospholipid phosphatase